MAKDNSTPKKPFHEAFAEKIIAKLEEGTAPWQKPWTPGQYVAPYNPESGTVYKGINHLGLSLEGYEDPRWMTFKQAEAAGYRIKKGSHATTIVYYQFSREEDKLDDDGKPVLGENGEPEKVTVLLSRPIIRFSQVFNGSQIDGIPPYERKAPGHEWEAIERAETILENSGAAIFHDQRDRNFYTIADDEIHLTPKASFDAPDKYYATALHELGHWTRHPTRLNRESGPFGSEAYAKEELRAEISSWMLGQEIGIGHDPGQHAAYVESWIEALRKDPMEIVRACRDAEHIKSYLLGLELEKEQVRQEEKQVEKEAREHPIGENGLALPKEPALAKTYLNVPYKEKNLAKSYGAKWDGQKKLWYAPEGTDLVPLRQWMTPERGIEQQQCLDPRQEFAQKLADLGLDLKGALPELDGKMHRVPLLEKNGRGLDGAYCLHGDGRPAGWAQNHVSGEKVKLVATGVVLSPQERERQQREYDARIKAANEERARQYEEAARRSQGMWAGFNEVTKHPYLEAKGVESFGLKEDQTQGNLIVPMRNVEGELRGFQAISPEGQKAFVTGIQKSGNFHLIGAHPGQDLSKGEIILCEGYATGASLHMATKKPIAVAFDAGNLESVAIKLREKFPQAQITICADNDHGMAKNRNVQNVGVEKAEKAAKAVGGRVKVPTFSKEEMAKGFTDFNDLHKARGLDAVRKQLGVREVSKGMER